MKEENKEQTEIKESKIEKNVVFVSGNMNLSEKQFIQYYLPTLSKLCEDTSIYFNISDDSSCSEMTQVLLNKLLTDKTRVNIYCIGDKPKHYISSDFLCFWGFKTLEERDAAMTLSSDIDFHIILSGEGRSSVEKNLIRRNEPEYDYIKHYIKGNSQFWQMFYQDSNLTNEQINEKN